MLTRFFARGVIGRKEAHYSFALRFYHPEKGRQFTADGLERAFSYARGAGALLAKWFIPPVIGYSLAVLTKSMAAAILFRGAKRRYYLNRLSGFLDGYRTFRAQVRPDGRRVRS